VSRGKHREPTWNQTHPPRRFCPQNPFRGHQRTGDAHFIQALALYRLRG